MSERIKYRGYNITVNNYAASQSITVERDCNSIAVIQVGDTIAEINGIPLFPSTAPATIRGDVFTFSGNEMEVYKGQLKLGFRTPVGVNPQVIIIQQFYTDNYK